MKCVLQRADENLTPVVIRYLGLFDQGYGRHKCLDCTCKFTYLNNTSNTIFNFVKSKSIINISPFSWILYSLTIWLSNLVFYSGGRWGFNIKTNDIFWTPYNTSITCTCVLHSSRYSTAGYCFVSLEYLLEFLFTQSWDWGLWPAVMRNV